ncbi:mannose-6-phosphate isomerase, class I [Cryobacterium psychrophilum]|uniref:mannose-6-phosphate isomerase n=1 Tax=Cryobacterium psychrophilum TaxID=41988 RepID=A0A4Y8KLC0_9MICO|nr:mannose-6-phosphate isomerase, class I [Cryobacterium psychrophilum]TDW30709.1 mannose-6-phosphate isomerase type 1 [Cryobacterium psychrophilum]TFD76608.1 mannose-6-phosphate isomerase, class I [Cryobacterium psychrophilum]
MFVGITNTPRNYAWGSAMAIADLMGHEPSGQPEAELWLGAHAGSPSKIEDPGQVGGATNLAEWIAAAPEVALGAALAGASSVGAAGSAPLAGGAGATAASPRLPFLLKILAADRPLSLQAHPTSERALEGFELENASDVPVDAGTRNYRDPFHKPELIFALSETFEALSGFRDLGEVRRIIDELRALDVATDDPQAGALDALESRLTGPDAVRDTVDWLLRDGRGGDSGEVKWLVERVVVLAEHAVFLAGGGAVITFARELATVQSLAAEYPGDPGIVIALLVNRVSLKRGEALYLPAGNIHAYLSGLGIEVMAASDNVLRGGLTPKHIDIDELLAVLDFTPVAPPYLVPTVDSHGVSVFRPDVPDFQLVHIVAEAAAAAAVPVMRQFTLTGPGIAICTAGGFLVAGAQASVQLKRGQSVYVTPDEGTLTFAGTGEVFLATTGT